MDTNQMRDISREQFEAYRDKRNAELEAEGHKPGSRWHISNAHYPTWEASRAAVVVELPMFDDYPASMERDMRESLRSAVEAQGLKVAP
ncbi:hypothetical protein CMV24_29500 [Pseudomonas plecoglossicida]|uniref:Uncharacterized protein n=1 Tax=Pseudomonas plecoglossicida TaxID=70775 RepID=A0A2A3LWK7_PSEDL|nr:hypothetical protein [Pseudomonas plecoglossicida]PBJ92002.1 hypothetical protein CMV24_29500 [Pseudomonas plecoglossicida]